jgi:hypothetical protein
MMKLSRWAHIQETWSLGQAQQAARETAINHDHEATNARGGINLSAYDDNNNKTNEIAYLNGAPYATNRFVFDPTNGFLLATFDPLNRSNVFPYNEFGQMLTSTDPRGHTSSNIYNPTMGNLLISFDALNHSTTNIYDEEFEADKDVDVPEVWSLGTANALVRIWKYYWHFKQGHPLNYLDGALGFTQSGFDGTLKSPNKNVFRQCQIRSGVRCGQQNFEWHWLPEHKLSEIKPLY